MKLTVYLLALVFIAFVSSSTIVKITVEDETDYASLFDTFLADQNIDIESDALGYEARLAIFKETHLMIEAHNRRYRAGLETFEMGINQFAYMSEEEKRNYVSQVKPSEPFNVTEIDEPGFEFENAADELRDVSWGKYMQPVQNQKSCGSCYVFAAIATMEAQIRIHFRQSSKLSEQEAMECTRGCNGGQEYYVYNYAKGANGITAARSYPYRGIVQSGCRRHQKVAHSRVTKYYNFPGMNKALNALNKYGPVTADFTVYPSFFHYSRGVYQRTNSDTKVQGYHAVVFIGYGSNYWIVRNSWGPSWGVGGHVYFRRGINTCKIDSSSHLLPQMQ